MKKLLFYLFNDSVDNIKSESLAFKLIILLLSSIFVLFQYYIYFDRFYIPILYDDFYDLSFFLYVKIAISLFTAFITFSPIIFFFNKKYIIINLLDAQIITLLFISRIIIYIYFGSFILIVCHYYDTILNLDWSTIILNFLF